MIHREFIFPLTIYGFVMAVLTFVTLKTADTIQPTERFTHAQLSATFHSVANLGLLCCVITLCMIISAAIWGD